MRRLQPTLSRSTTFWLFVITTIVIGDAARVRAQGLPVGWRLPTPSELSDEERKDHATRYAKATADFNGDGIVSGVSAGDRIIVSDMRAWDAFDRLRLGSR